MTELKDATLEEITAELKKRSSLDETPAVMLNLETNTTGVPAKYVVPEDEQQKAYGLINLTIELLKMIQERVVDALDVYEY